jgi:hypothetical protein
MKRSLKKITPIAAVVLLVLALAGGVLACGSAQAAEETTSTPSPTSTAKASPTKTRTTSAPTPKEAAPTPSKVASPSTPKASPSPSKTAVPKLNDVSFTLSLEEEQEYTENTTPIYLKATQTLHMNWLVVKGGDHIYLTFTMPNGDLIMVRNDGTLAASSPGEIVQEQLTKSGDLVFRPADNNWAEGYYLFHPQIHKYDPSVTVKLLYWIE